MNYRHHTYLYITVFCTGAAVLILEILGTRLFAPFFGSTIYVWTSLITVTLGALACGYLAGGALSDKKPDATILYFLIFASGIATLLIPTIVNPVMVWSDMFGLKFGPLVASLIIFTVPLALLGSVSPYIIKLSTSHIKHLGINAGRIFSVATLGSLTGGLLAGFILAPVYPADAIIVFVGIGLVGLYLIWQIL